MKVMENKKVYIVMQIIETDGLRDFDIMMVTFDRDKAIKELNRLFKLDSTQDFEYNGIEYENEMCYRSGYEDGFTEYCVVENEVD